MMVERGIYTVSSAVLLLLLITIQPNYHYNVLAFSSSPSKSQSAAQQQQQQQQQPPYASPSFNSNISPSDLQTIKNQLGYIPTNLLSISARTQNQTPLALQTYPLNGGSKHRNRKSSSSFTKTPFPTLFWLCHSDIHTAISNLERLGYVKKLELRLIDDTNACENMRKSHEEYAKLRWNVLSREDQELLEQLPSLKSKKKKKEEKESTKSSSTGILQMIKYSGIAGSNYQTTDFVPSVKCLHAHYAHYRSTANYEVVDDDDDDDRYECSNIIGKWTHEILKEQYPDLIL